MQETIEGEVEDMPLMSLNIMKKRNMTGHLLGSTVIRKDYDGLGGRSSFVQPLGQPKVVLKQKHSRKVKRLKTIQSFPPLPTLDNFIDLT